MLNDYYEANAKARRMLAFFYHSFEALTWGILNKYCVQNMSNNVRNWKHLMFKWGDVKCVAID